MTLAEVPFDFGSGNRSGLVASPAHIFGLLGVVAKRTKGKNETALAIVIHERGYFNLGCGYFWLDVIHGNANRLLV